MFEYDMFDDESVKQREELAMISEQRSREQDRIDRYLALSRSLETCNRLDFQDNDSIDIEGNAPRQRFIDNILRFGEFCRENMVRGVAFLRPGDKFERQACRLLESAIAGDIDDVIFSVNRIGECDDNDAVGKLSEFLVAAVDPIWNVVKSPDLQFVKRSAKIVDAFNYFRLQHRARKWTVEDRWGDAAEMLAFGQIQLHFREKYQLSNPDEVARCFEQVMFRDHGLVGDDLWTMPTIDVAELLGLNRSPQPDKDAAAKQVKAPQSVKPKTTASEVVTHLKAIQSDNNNRQPIGLSCNQVARDLDCSPNTVSKAFTRLGWIIVDPKAETAKTQRTRTVSGQAGMIAIEEVASRSSSADTNYITEDQAKEAIQNSNLPANHRDAILKKLVDGETTPSAAINIIETLSRRARTT